MSESIVKWSAAIGGGLVSFLFGEWSSLISFFMILLVIDYCTGLIASIRDGTGLSSDKGYWGIAKKGLTILIIVIGHRADVAFGTNFIMSACLYFYIANELISILENYTRMNILTPNVLKKLVGTLKDKDDINDQIK